MPVTNTTLTILPFTSVWKFLEVTIYQVSYFNKCSIWPRFCCTTHSRRWRNQAIVNAWQQLSQAFIDKSINEWRRRLECVVQQNGAISNICLN